MNLLSRHVLCVIAALLTSFPGFPVHAAELQEGVVLLVHPESATTAFRQRLRQAPGQVPGERFAVVKLAKGAWGEASYALVRLPNGLPVDQDDRVALAPSPGDLLANPGTGVVSRRLPSSVSPR